MSALTLSGLAILFAISTYLLSRLGFRDAGLYATLGSTFLLVAIGQQLQTAVFSLSSLSGLAAVSGAGVTVSKVLSIGYLTGIGADVCTDLGEAGLARALTFGGRILIFSLAMPYLSELIRFGTELAS